jgi:hypothetical protein
MNYSKIYKKLCFPKLSTFNTAQANTLPVGTKFQYVVLWNVPNKQLQHAVQRTTKNYYPKLVKESGLSLSCPHRTLPEQIRDQQPPNSSTLFYFIFQRNTTIVLLNGYEELIKNCPKEFLKSCPQNITRAIPSPVAAKHQYVYLIV